MNGPKLSLVALLPMKAHSERVPGKNFRSLAGKPLFRWMLDTLISMPEVDRVVINTDARTILEEHGVGSRIGGEKVRIRDRTPELCGDFVSMNLILEDDLRAVPSELYLMTHVTNPLLSASTIRRALDALRAADGGADSLFAVNRFQSRFYDAAGKPVNHDPAQLLRTQDLDPLFEENSCLYLFSAESFARSGARIGERPRMFETPRLESIDIDDAEDWALAEALATVSGASAIGAGPT
ncbi:MAG: acylneuraminate cytidylyltransferase family protein [Holophagales bacterium]|nr:acylneuraminate cytidylyltransferase family protein [Holophagales bacterium]